jgi:hypothetical protein
MTQTIDRDTLIREVQQALDKATPGPWEAYDNYVKIGSVLVEITSGNPSDADSSNDTHLIAHAPEWLTALLAVVQAQQTAIDALVYAANRVAFTHGWADELGTWNGKHLPDEALLAEAVRKALTPPPTGGQS